MKPLVAVALLCALMGCKDKPKDTPAGSPKRADAGKAISTIDAALVPALAAGERWGGAILIPDQAPLEFELVVVPGDPPTAMIAIPAQGLEATDAIDVTYSAEAMTFTLMVPGGDDAAHARFQVQRADDGKNARGSLHQNGADMQVMMKRLADDQHVGDGTRSQAPKPPFPYDQREATYQSKDGTTLAGTLTIPRGAGKHPAVVLISGTGLQDRDGKLFGHSPFLVLADHLSRAGIAVLRVDDRGVGGSGGDTGATTIDDKVDDVLAGVAWLAGQADVDPAKIGLIGHSEGGGIAPLAAVRPQAQVAFVVVLAGPGINGAELSLIQTELQMRAAGVDDKVIAAQIAGQRTIVELQVAGADAAALRAAVTTHIDAMAAVVPEDQRAPYTGAGRQATIDTSVTALDSKASRSFSALEPSVALVQLRVPILVLNGSLDLQVPTEPNFAKIRAALEESGNTDVTIEELAGLNHLFQPAKRGLPAEYGLIDITFDPAALGKISAWLRTRAGLK